MLEEQDREWMKATMFEQSTKAVTKGMEEHRELTHAPLDKRVDAIDKKAGFNVRLVLIIAVGCVAIGALAKTVLP